MSLFLIVEDEKNLGSTLSDYFVSQGHEVHWARHAENARRLFTTHNPDVVLMDLGLPDGHGMELAQEFRALSKQFILFFLSAQNDPQTRLQGLEIGAEDFIGKPFQLRELTLRLGRALQQQKAKALAPELTRFGKLSFYPRRFEIHDAHGAVINLSLKECGVLEILVARLGHIVTRDEMLDAVWGPEAYPSDRTLDNFIVKFRKWIETDPHCGLELTTVRGIGHKLTFHSTKTKT